MKLWEAIYRKFAPSADRARIDQLERELKVGPRYTDPVLRDLTDSELRTVSNWWARLHRSP